MAENKKKRKWLSTNALKEFINDITEEELSAEELYSETKNNSETSRMMDEEENFIQEQEGLINLKMDEESESKIVVPPAGLEIQGNPEELAMYKKETESRIQELEIENDELKGKLEFERIRLEDELKERDRDWKRKFAEIDEEKKETKLTVQQLQQQLNEKQRELIDTDERAQKENAEREAASVKLKEVTKQLEEYQKNYLDAQEENKKKEEKLAQIKADHKEEINQFNQLKKQYNELEQDYQQLHTINQKNETKVNELQEENDTLLELLDEKEQETEAELTSLREENAKYRQTIQQLKEQVAQKLKNALEESHMDVGEQGQLPEEQIQEETIEDIDQLAAEKEALNSALFDAHEEIAKLEEKTSNLDQLEAEKERLASRLADAQIELSKLKEQKANEESLELIQAKKQVDELMEKNEQLKKEVIQSQQEIGEVLISAKKQANRTIEEAQTEAKHLISSAELELENISNRARKILIEVSESRKNVLSIYDDLEFKVEALSNGTLLKEIKKNKQDQNRSEYFDTTRN
ncbi:hypothetical protein [Enterococcus sp. AZ196]|uniref:hypothetical protein n=1 Tax=Enterococcus sp. AZ196 TaxID=2774659 RepID=UPI003D2E29B6